MQSSLESLAANTTDEQNRIREKYWRSVSSNERLAIHTVDDLWTWLGAEDYSQLADWDLSSGSSLYFRGQSDIAFGLTSSLYRQVRAAKPDSEIGELDLHAAEQELLSRMREEGLGRRMTDFELVTVLQHHLMPTRLIDVSRSPMESLYFAVEGNHGTDGTLFLLNPHNQDLLDFDREDVPWGSFRVTRRYGDGRWTNRVTVANHPALDPRMTAQNGTFLVGGLLRTYSGMTLKAGDESIAKPLRTDVMTLAVQFPRNRRRTHSSAWGATGWVLVIPSGWKRPLLERLRQQSNISHDTMYPAFGEVARLARYVVTSTVAALA